MQIPNPQDPLENYCGTTYAARLLGLSVGTIQTLVEKNELQAWKTQGGHRRISLPSILQYQRKQNMPLITAAKADQRLKILAVDDDPLAREMLKNFAARSDMSLDCTIMASGLEALIDMASIQPDVLIADLNMPGVDGFELLRAGPTIRHASAELNQLTINALNLFVSIAGRQQKATIFGKQHAILQLSNTRELFVLLKL